MTKKQRYKNVNISELTIPFSVEFLLTYAPVSSPHVQVVRR